MPYVTLTYSKSLQVFCTRGLFNADVQLVATYMRPGIKVTRLRDEPDLFGYQTPSVTDILSNGLERMGFRLVQVVSSGKSVRISKRNDGTVFPTEEDHVYYNEWILHKDLPA